MEKKIRVALAGTGKAAGMHARSLKNIPNIEFTAVSSRSIEKSQQFAKEYSVSAYADIGTMVRKEKIDVVIVCTPHPYHLEVTLPALVAGANVLVEKPLAASLSDCNEMIRVAEVHKKKLGVISQRRFYPPSLRIRQAIDEGRIGTPMLGTVYMLGWRDEKYYASDPWRGSWEKEGGGVLVNQAPHQLDLLLWYMGGEIEEVYGVWKNINHPYIEVEDTAVGIIKFRNGAIANIVVSNSQKPGIYGKVHIHGSNGASIGVQTDGGAMFIAGVSSIVDPPKIDIWTIPGEENFPSRWEKEDSDFFSTIDPIEFYIRKQQEDFIQAVIDDRDPLVTGLDGKKTVELFSAIYKSTQTGKPVSFPL